MKSAPVPDNEDDRLAALRRLTLLDTPATESFDRVTRACARMLQTPIVLVSLVDEHRQWFKSRFGLEATETPRDVSLCGHAVAADRPLVVPDTRDDPRFADNPLVIGEPQVRAYLGIPIHAPDGQAIGTLCAIDHRPRNFRDDDVLVMTRMAKVLEQLIRVRHPGSGAPRDR
jgi:GAF domain-containing protein